MEAQQLRYINMVLSTLHSARDPNSPFSSKKHVSIKCHSLVFLTELHKGGKKQTRDRKVH